jgi:hypothetical protein
MPTTIATEPSASANGPSWRRRGTAQPSWSTATSGTEICSGKCRRPRRALKPCVFRARRASFAPASRRSCEPVSCLRHVARAHERRTVPCGAAGHRPIKMVGPELIGGANHWACRGWPRGFLRGFVAAFDSATNLSHAGPERHNDDKRKPETGTTRLPSQQRRRSAAR